MPTITVEPELYSRIEKAALARKANIDEILGQAIQRYLGELDRLDTVKQTLEKAAASGSRQTFHNAISANDPPFLYPSQLV